jgi:hypothetical protein
MAIHELDAQIDAAAKGDKDKFKHPVRISESGVVKAKASDVLATVCKGAAQPANEPRVRLRHKAA